MVNVKNINVGEILLVGLLIVLILNLDGLYVNVYVLLDIVS